jgi:hypothetical protein
MGVSVSRLYSALTSLSFWGKDKEVRILMVGLDSAGKVSQGLDGCVIQQRLYDRGVIVGGGEYDAGGIEADIMIMDLFDIHRLPSYTDYKSEK